MWTELLFFLFFTLCSFFRLSSGASGIATYYGGNDNGNACGYDGIPTSSFPYGYYTAAGSNTFNSGYGCGACYKIKCTGPYGTNPSCKCTSKTITVLVADQCYECETNHFDLNTKSMKAITNDAGTCGKITITYSRTNCAFSGNFYVRNKDGTSEYWYGMHLDNVAGNGAIKAVTLYKGSSTIGTCSKSDGPTYWTCTGEPLPSTPLTIKLKDDQGKTLKASNCITSYTGGKSMNCKTNYKSSSFYEEETDDEDMQMLWTDWFALIVSLLAVICIIVVGVYCFIKKRMRKGEVSFDNNDDVVQEQENNNQKETAKQEEVEADIEITTNETVVKA